MRAIISLFLAIGMLVMPAKKNFGIMGAGAQEQWVDVLGRAPGGTRAMQMPPGAATGGGPPTFGFPIDDRTWAQRLADQSGDTRTDEDGYGFPEKLDRLRQSEVEAGPRGSQQELIYVNARRAKYGLPPLTLRELLQQERSRTGG